MSNTQQMKEVVSYLIGYRLGSQIIPQMLPGILGDDLAADKLAKGVLDALGNGIDSSIINENAEKHQNNFIAMLQARADKRGQENLELGRRYMEENGKRTGVVTTPSGLQYEVLTPGNGESYDADKHGDAPTAEVMYKGTLVDGTVFDQSHQPVKFNIRQVIPGFTEALKLMPIGAKWRVTIPANLAYGANGPSSIGPNSTLIFDMELLGLTK